jgi:hypothetical protein
MSVTLGAGWQLTHLTDRVVVLKKEDWAYRKLTERDGYVKVRGEPGMSRNDLIEKARLMAQKNDEKLGEMLAQQLTPRRLGGYQMTQKQLAQRFGVPGQEPEERTYQP